MVGGESIVAKGNVVPKKPRADRRKITELEKQKHDLHNYAIISFGVFIVSIFLISVWEPIALVTLVAFLAMVGFAGGYLSVGSQINRVKEGNTPGTAADYSGISGWGLVAGIFLGYIAVYALAFLLGAVISILIYATFLVYLANDANDKNDRFLRGFVIGGLGILLGFFINWIVGLARGRSTGYKFIVSLVSWIIIVGIFMAIVYAEASTPPASGSSYSLKPGYYLHWPFTLSAATQISCAFTSGFEPVSAYIMDNSSFSSYSSGYAFYPIYQSNSTTSFNINENLSAGEWDLVISAPPNNVANASIVFQNCNIP